MMGYATQFASTYAGLGGLLFFFIFFVGMALWIFRPGAKGKYQKDAEIPLKD
jgi:cbb3-type cytochrome oxidase subunit 3